MAESLIQIIFLKLAVSVCAYYSSSFAVGLMT